MEPELPRDPASVELYLDDATEPFSRHRPPANASIDTTQLADGPHVLRIVARDTVGNVGRRSIPFVVQNGPGITVTGIRANSRIGGRVDLQVNAFSSAEPFDVVRAESSGPIPVWTWVVIAVIAAWAGWYGIEEFPTPASFAATPTYAEHPSAFAKALAPAGTGAAPAFSGKGAAGGFDYGATGAKLYTQNCAACHGASGAGVPTVFPSLMGDPVVNAADPREHLHVVLRGLHGKSIGGQSYSGQMPAFAQLTDAEIAAIVDHERTSWGNHAPIVAPGDVKRVR
ncbi:MAG: c-type cytochrome [Vulcanimicrobiaceae bacterium]